MYATLPREKRKGWRPVDLVVILHLPERVTVAHG
jgi:hypothetical protein